jgi:hypothetical protein
VPIIVRDEVVVEHGRRSAAAVVESMQARMLMAGCRRGRHAIKARVGRRYTGAPASVR